MEIIRETNTNRAKTKMTDIRRSRKGPIIHNYYNNCDQDDEIFSIYGEDTVILWDNDHGVLRAYFYSCNPDELVEMLKLVPEGIIIDYLTRVKDEHRELFERAGWEQKYEMLRMSAGQLSPEEQQEIAENAKTLEETLYYPENVRAAEEHDCDAVYEKLYEIFDPRESHLCTREELLQYIQNRWVSVYHEDGQLMGFHIFTVENNRFYGYQIWNGTGPQGYYSLTRNSDKLFAEYVKEVPPEKIKPSYSWVNSKNRKSKRLIEFWGQRFDGLYDFVYEKQ